MFQLQKLKNRIKRSSFLGIFYLVVVGIFIKVLQIFIRPNEKQILFISYSGRQFSDTPREAFKILKEDPLFEDFDLVWAFNNPKKFNQKELGRKISANSPTFFYHLLKSKYWIANSSIDRLIPFSHKRNIYIQFWHGVPLKTLGHAEIGLSRLVQYWYDHVDFDFMFTYGNYDLEKFKDIFPKTKRFVEHGQLRKNIVKRYEHQVSPQKIKRQLKIKSNKPILLYVPTFRGYNSKEPTTLSDKALKELSKKYTVIYRGHYFSDGEAKKSVITANKYSLYKLFMITDVLITDFSSVFFDFVVYGKKIYLFQPDINEYYVRRGVYLDAKKDLELPVAYSEKELIKMIQDNNYNFQVLDDISSRYNPHDAEESVDALRNILIQLRSNQSL